MVVIAIVAAYFLFVRGGENVLWAIKGKDGTDPPSFRRWQERQKLRGARGSVTGRTDGRLFWAHLWHDAHASAHEWRQRKYGRRIENRRRRWQAEDVERQQAQAIAPCVFCGAGRDEPCREDCPEQMAHAANRASVRAATEPTEPTEPMGSEPSRTTVPPATEPTVPEAPSHTVPAEPDRASRAGRTEPSRRASTPEPPSHRAAEPARRLMPPETATPTPTPRTEHTCPIPDERPTPPENNTPEHRPSEEATRSEPKKYVDDDTGKVTPITRNRPVEVIRADDETSNGGNVTPPATRNGAPAVPTGEFTGYEATVAGWDTITRLTQQLDAAYERQMAQLRQHKADDQTVGRVAHAREVNEAHMAAAVAAKNDWVTRQGAVKETKDATGARGDEALHVN